MEAVLKEIAYLGLAFKVNGARVIKDGEAAILFGKVPAKYVFTFELRSASASLDRLDAGHFHSL